MTDDELKAARELLANTFACLEHGGTEVYIDASRKLLPRLLADVEDLRIKLRVSLEQFEAMGDCNERLVRYEPVIAAAREYKAMSGRSCGNLLAAIDALDASEGEP